MYLSKRDCDR